MLRTVEEKILAEKRLTKRDALRLFETDDIFSLGRLASFVAEKKNGNRAYFIRNRHINPTNICVNRCRFCAFSRSAGQEGAFELTVDEIVSKLRPLVHTNRPISEVHIVGGLHPDWPFEYYLEMISTIKKHFPKLHIKAFTAVEVDYMARISGLGLKETLTALKSSGLGSMPGGGAEIFAQAIRNRLCPEKISGKRWLEVMSEAHDIGIRTNCTMLYGHIESYEDRVDHLISLRALQEKTGGFQAFIPLAYHPKNTKIKGRYTSGIDDLKTIAISRLVLDNFDHIKAYWIMLGEKISQLALKFGADDFDGTIIEEKITHAAGALTGEQLTANELVYLIRRAGKVPVERDSFYKEIRLDGKRHA
ncbi:Aminodeoxyfutalosine synthase [Candidatus Sulfobium mesophilum]|uniref:Aminodeoxyfutalosine synthase n=1 Tax=Candidatus Sulfobium mesophilum TaxID=2016548 RepID=A0A2U3QE49_9BACT|nr:Aminodeoxyfutalosine synthase [Candidatus Sulfobium mesophilum]